MDISRADATLDDRVVESLLAGHPVVGYEAVSRVVRQVRSGAPGPAPAPSAALATMLDQGLTPALLPVASRRASVTWGTRLAIGATALLASLMGAATANALPDSLQSAVADAVDALTPFDLPRPPATDDPTGEDADLHEEEPGTVESDPDPLDSDDSDTDDSDTDSPDTDDPDTDSPDTDASGSDPDPAPDEPEASDTDADTAD